MANVISNVVVVVLGAALGAGLRLGSEWGLVHGFAVSAEYCLLAVNSVGCAAFAYCANVLSHHRTKLFWLTGCWGTYTSFSAVSAALLLMVKLEAGTANSMIYSFLTVLTWWLGFLLGGYVSRANKRFSSHFLR